MSWRSISRTVVLSVIVASAGCSTVPPQPTEQPVDLVTVRLHVHGFQRSKSGAI